MITLGLAYMEHGFDDTGLIAGLRRATQRIRSFESRKGRRPPKRHKSRPRLTRNVLIHQAGGGQMITRARPNETDAMGLRVLKNKHAGQWINICGTGPSLDIAFDKGIEGPRILVNRAAMVIPAVEDMSYWLALDDAWAMHHPGNWEHLLAHVRTGEADLIGVFRDPMGNTQGRRTPAPRGPNIVLWDGSKPNNQAALKYSREKIAKRNILHTSGGSPCVAMHLAWYMGARGVILAGLDGTDGYAECVVDLYGGRRRRGGFAYAPGIDNAKKACQALNLPVHLLQSSFAAKAANYALADRVYHGVSQRSREPQPQETASNAHV